MICKENHDSIQGIMADLPFDQGGLGRHKCAACAYVRGFRDGMNHIEVINLANIMNDLPESQAGKQRHKSPVVAYMKGYSDGIIQSYQG